jgi:hypothetical protein
MQAQQLHQQITKKQEEALQAQNDVLTAQAQDLQAKAKKVDIEAESLMSKTAAELDKLEKETQKIIAETFLTLEKADTEEVKNHITKYEHATNLDAPKTEESEELEERYVEDDEPIVKMVRDENTGEIKTATLVNGQWDIK